MINDLLEPDKRVYEMHAEICKVLAHPTRLRLLDALRSGPKSPSKLAELTNISKASVSSHLAAMRGKGLVRRIRTGRTVTYTVTDSRLYDACSTLRSLIREQLRAGGELAERGFGLSASQTQPKPTKRK